MPLQCIGLACMFDGNRSDSSGVLQLRCALVTVVCYSKLCFCDGNSFCFCTLHL